MGCGRRECRDARVRLDDRERPALPDHRSAKARLDQGVAPARSRPPGDLSQPPSRPRVPRGDHARGRGRQRVPPVQLRPSAVGTGRGSLGARAGRPRGIGPESFDGRTWAAIAWAQAYARGDFAEVPDAIDANFRQHFSAQEQADIELVVRTMFWMNETSNGVRAGVKRAKRVPVPGSTLPRELQATALYAVGAPLILALLCVKQRRNPIAMLKRHQAVLPRVRPTRSEHDLRPWRGIRRLGRVDSLPAMCGHRS